MAAALLDGLPSIVFTVTVLVLQTRRSAADPFAPPVLSLPRQLLFSGLLFLLGLANLVYQGRTGHSVGKGIVGIRLRRLDRDGPPGIGLSIGRAFVHVIDALPCYLGFLWPLWDERRQTFADKILKTVVVRDTT